MRRSLPWISTLFVLATACGRAPAEGSKAPIAPESQDEQAPGAPASTEGARDEPSTLEEAEAALARAKSELDSALSRVAFAQPPADMAEQAPVPPPAPAGAAAPPARSESKPLEAERAAEPATAKKEGASNCELACRAYSSLTRAVDAVCRLDSAGERCTRARRVASDAGARVASCSCPKP